MWQIQWMLALIPDNLLVWIYSVITITGIIFYFGGFLCKYWPFKMIPIIGQFPFLGKFLGAILVIVGTLLFGGYINEMSWRDKVHQLEEKIKESEAKSADANVKLGSAIKEKNALVKSNLSKLQGQIYQDSAKIDAECKVPREAVEILNKAAETPKRNKQ